MAGSRLAGTRIGFDTALARAVTVFGTSHSHHAYLFINRRANRLEVLVYDGFGIWAGATTAEPGQFVWPRRGNEPKRQTLTQEQLSALVASLPWQRIGPNGVIHVV